MDLNAIDETTNRLDLSGLGKPALIGLAALVIMVAVFAGKNIIDTATANDFEIEHDQAAVVEDGDSAQSSVFVHISGAVATPGLVELEKGSRVADAVSAAGGFTDDAELESVNLARVIEDGEHIHVASTSETAAGESAQEREGVGSPSKSTSATSAASASSGLVNINNASQSELESLPGSGPSTAAKIIADRASNGSFTSVDELTRVSGIGEKKLASLVDLICV